MNYIIYLAHGDEGYINECRFSLLKYLSIYNLNPPAQTELLIYTDKPATFEAFIPFFKNFSIQEIGGATIDSWLEGTGYIHRAKTRVMQQVAATRKGNLMFLDTDTYITAPIEPIWRGIDKGEVYMHVSEGVVDQERNPVFKKWDKFLKTADLSYGRKKFVYSKNFQVWNTGVLGFSSDYAAVLDDVLLLMDSIYRQFPKHIAEQVAASYCFYKKTFIKPAADRVFHYWNLKEFRTFLNNFFETNLEESIPNLVKSAAAVDVQVIQKEKEAFENRPPLQKLLRRLSGKQWSIENYLKRL